MPLSMSASRYFQIFFVFTSFLLATNMSSVLKLPSIPPWLNVSPLFGPSYLNIPCIKPHLLIVFLSAIFYNHIYTVIGPAIFSLLLPHPQSTPTKANTTPQTPKIRAPNLALYHFSITLVSITQSFVNSAVAIYLSYHTEFRQGLSAQERYLGYHEKTAQALAIATGYFCFHAVETWFSRDVWGVSMFAHGVCALGSVLLGFRPLALHYTAIFLIWEVPNLFLNIQRQLDRYGYRHSLARKINRWCILSTYATIRLGMGTYSLFWMASDMITTLSDPEPKLGVAHVWPGMRREGEESLQTVAHPPVFLALFQMGAMIVLAAQGFWWFRKIAWKGDF